VNVLIVGAGPAGLTLAYRIKQMRAARDSVHVLEGRNATESVGWGITLPPGSLARLDYDVGQSHVLDEVTQSFGDTKCVTRSISLRTLPRDVLVSFLRERCRSLGIDLRFDSRVSSAHSPTWTPSRLDLVVGAMAYTHHRPHRLGGVLRPFHGHVAARARRLATDRLFGRQIVKVVRESSYRLFNAWGYQYCDSMSFIHRGVFRRNVG
jgi:hypothetical protein